MSALLLLQGCTYLGDKKPGEDKVLDFDLHELGISKNSNGPMIQPKPEEAHEHGAWAEIGNKYERDQDFVHAVEAFKKCTELAPGEKYYWDSLANNYKRLDKFEESRAAFLEGLSLYPNDLYTMAAIAYCDEQLAKDHESLMFYLSSIALKPDFPESWKGVASTLHRVGLDKYLGKAEKLRANSNEPYNLALANQINEEFLASHDEKDPLYWGHYINRGYLALKALKVSEAESVFRDILGRCPADSLEVKRARSGLCLMFMTIGKNKEALEMFDKAVAVTPKDPDIWYCRALIFDRQGDSKHALDFLGKATALAPERIGWSQLFQTWLAQSKERETKLERKEKGQAAGEKEKKTL